jgi:hypothetical protein
MDGVKIQEYCDCYSLIKIMRTESKAEFIYRLMYMYYVDSYNEFIALRKMRDEIFPDIEHIDKAIKILKSRSMMATKEMFDTIRYDERFKLGVRPIYGTDLFDCVPAINQFDVDYSIMRLYTKSKKRMDGHKVLDMQVLIPVGMVLMDEKEQ